MMRIRVVLTMLVVGGVVAVGVAYAISYFPRDQQNVALPLGKIIGRVLDPDGQPVAGARVEGTNFDSPMGRYPTTMTNEQGEFILENLAPGTYRLGASKEEDDYPPTDSSFHNAGFVEVPQVTVYEGQTTSGVIVHLGPKAAKLTGRVLDVIAKKPIVPPMQGIQIILQRVDEPESSYATGPNIEGEFSVLIPPVPVKVEVSVPGYEKRLLGSLHLKREETKRLDITLPPDK